MERLSVYKGKIVDEHEKPVYLRGTCIGGWMNMEDFINGYPGTESGMKLALKNEIGADKTELFMNCIMDNFLAEEDIQFIKSTGANCVRLPLSYKHFEDDMNPFVYKEEGLKRLDAMIELCNKYELYVILDLHAAAGWQNCHWHSDNERGNSLLWTVKHYQDRMVGLWEELARRYKVCANVAGYNIVNEPSTGNPNGEHGYDFYHLFQPDWKAINDLYRRVTKAIRQIDSKHLIFLEGDFYARLFSGLDEPFDVNTVYSNHNYISSGFGPGEYPGYYGDTYWDKHKMKAEFLQHEGYLFTQKHNVPLWVGEFGSQYHGAKEDIKYRIKSMDDQLSLYNELNAHWTTWTYKDPGIMGWVTLNPENEYMKIIAPIQKMKKQIGAENFVALYEGQSKGKEIAKMLADYILETSGNIDLSKEDNAYTLNYAVLTGYAAATIQRTYAKKFKGYSEDDLVRIAESFKLSNCVPNEKYIALLKKRIAD
jgi:aryl-phospho-beta-D-glucosidase BglC (GH1 family)